MGERLVFDKFAERTLGRIEGMTRAREATAQQRQASGASDYGAGLRDPFDGDYGFRPAGKRGPRDIPMRTLERARTDSVASYRTNPMGHGIIDTFVAFAVGDSGLTLQCVSDVVRPIAEGFWFDPKNNLVKGAELMARDFFIMGEQCHEAMVGEMTGVTRRSPIHVSRIQSVDLLDGNPLWPATVNVRTYGSFETQTTPMSVIQVDDISGLRTGDVHFWAGFKTLETDTRGAPLMMPILDWLDDYDQILSNLIDRTALMRYLCWDVEIDGDQAAVDEWVANRGNRQMPRSGTMEAHTKAVQMKPVTASTGASEDVTANQAVLTTVAAGAGLSKTWLAEPDNANRATSLTMAEPVRRRVGSVQNEYIGYLTEMVRHAVDRAVAAGRIPAYVEVAGAGGAPMWVPASETVTISGPPIAASDEQISAEVLKQVADAITSFKASGAMSPGAMETLAKVAWEGFSGTPWTPDLDLSDANLTADALAAVDAKTPLTAV